MGIILIYAIILSIIFIIGYTWYIEDYPIPRSMILFTIRAKFRIKLGRHLIKHDNLRFVILIIWFIIAIIWTIVGLLALIIPLADEWAFSDFKSLKEERVYEQLIEKEAIVSQLQIDEMEKYNEYITRSKKYHDNFWIGIMYDDYYTYDLYDIDSAKSILEKNQKGR